jgi:hypothetical protein
MAVPELRAVDQEPGFRRFGLGWQFRPPEAPVVMSFTHLADRSSEFRAELLVERRDGGHLLRRSTNLLGSNTFRDLAKDLAIADGGAGYPWQKILESAFESVIRAARIGPELQTLHGQLQRPKGISWLCEGLVMANVPNVWLAAGSTGKSTFASGLAVHSLVGERFLGRETAKVIPLYLDWESDDDDFHEKVWLWSRWLGLDSVPPIHRLRMRGPASRSAAAIGHRIDSLGVGLVIWDGVQAAGGPLGQHASYESVAQELEMLIGLLPETTHLLLDHVTGDELKTGAVPLKGRGSTRKVEWARNQWTMILDRDEQRSGRHVVGWTHTKINRGSYETPFGVELLHRPDELGYSLLDESAVAALAERMPWWKQIMEIVKDRPLSPRDVALAWKGSDDKRNVELVNRLLQKDLGVRFKQYTDDTIGLSDKERQRQAQGQGTEKGERSHLRMLPPGHEEEEVDELPF